MDAPRAEELFYHLWLPEVVKRKVKALTLRYISCSEASPEFLQSQSWGPKQSLINSGAQGVAHAVMLRARHLLAF